MASISHIYHFATLFLLDLKLLVSESIIYKQHDGSLTISPTEIELKILILHLRQ